ncbi:hypothetical protein PhaeoP83_04121 (plasmid) [Phaeobacter inhibens]|uniref:Uncharacterized protein n=1 Tax=Phaeobacter inhibens TaxID=221822 RepID=A0ABN5GU06_9RHOB|nr:hypothetical protein [Phaeobacter inhibens]AUQ52339.1 hypothetical protein PhaeoP83_04121 [Phaeobacter inhibens]AUQ96944.1 hypothetical protein PhaeoP66_04218 [Phaeobacter inhibens]
MYKVWTGTPPPGHTYSGEDEYASDCAEDSADDASASTSKEANGASNKAAKYPAFHLFSPVQGNTTANVCHWKAALHHFCVA